MLLGLLPLAAAAGGPPPTVQDAPPTTASPDATLAHDAKGLGFGVLLGSPTGLSLAWRPGGRAWYDGAVAWSFERGTLHVHADALYVVATPTSPELPDLRFPVWLGAGLRSRIGDAPDTWREETATFGLRVAVGMSVVHDGFPVEGFLELAPGVGLYPETEPTFDAAVGARFYLPPRS